MPKIYLSIEDRECQRFCDFVRGELKRQGKLHRDLADELNLSAVSVTLKINGKVKWSLSEVIQTINYLGATYTIGETNERKKYIRSDSSLGYSVPASVFCTGYEATYSG